MNRNEILEKSRKENRNKDIYELEIIKQAGSISSLTAALLCAILFIAEILLGRGINYGLWSIFLAAEAATFTYKAVKLKKKHEILVAVLYCLMVVLLVFAHIYNLTH